MAVIHVLDKHTAELIAAGEVVERPSSVVKELVENAIDAGAKHICVEIERGGISRITVEDDGCGIEAEFIATAFIRHATSKIEKPADLDSIGTLGFRGEALASISAVARVELITRTEQDEYACCYRQAGGEELSAEAAARPVGTTVTVQDLFYNVPARMKFLKKDQSEANYVGDVVLRQALAHPEISFTYIKDGKEQFQTPGDERLLSAIYGVLSKDFAKNLLSVQQQSGIIDVAGFVTAPTACRGSRGMQFFYVNGRYVQNTTMTAAVEAAYKGMMMQGRFPGCVLNLTMPLDRVDVNVHPAKTEVRFANNNEIFDHVYRAVKLCLNGPGLPTREVTLAPAAGFSSVETQQAEPISSGSTAQPNNFTVSKEAEKAEFKGYLQPTSSFQPNGFVSKPVFASHSVDAAPSLLAQESPVLYQTNPLQRPASANVFSDTSLDIEKLPEEVPAAYVAESAPVQQSLVAEEISADVSLSASEKVPLRYIGEAFATYLIAERNDHLVLIDKHAAHERILYEKLVAGYGAVDGQMLLAPVTVNLDAAEKNALTENEELLAKAGFEVEDFGGNSVLIRAVPVDAADVSVVSLTQEIAAKLTLNARNTLSEKTDWVLHSIACRAAIKAGDRNQPEELILLAQDILDGKVPPFCPHGRPVVLRLTRKELEKQFGRLQ